MISVGLLASFSAIFVYSQLLGHRSFGIQGLNNGIQTCFTRVNQTYTAKMIGQGGATYLSPEFMMTSEECFSEAVSMTERIFQDTYIFSVKQMNKLVADVHWFHEKLEVKNSPFAKAVTSNDISNRFEKIEGLKETIVEGNESFQERIKKSQFALNMAMSILGVFALFLFLWEVRDQRRREIGNRVIERDAEVELLTEGVPQSSRVERVFAKAFENNDLEQCSALFQKYHTAILDGQMQYLITKDYHEDKITDQYKDVDQEISDFDTEEKDYNITLLQGGEGQVQVDNDENMENVLTQVVEHISSSVFHKGIRFELVVDDNIPFNSDRDILEQVFFHALNYSIGSCEEVATKRINVGLHRLGGTAIFEIEDSGTGFDPMLIKQELGIKKNEQIEIPLELKIVKEIVEENRGEINLENLLAEDGTVTGSRIRVIFRLQQSKDLNRGLVQIRKATKKELVREFSQSV